MSDYQKQHLTSHEEVTLLCEDFLVKIIYNYIFSLLLYYIIIRYYTKSFNKKIKECRMK